MNIDWNMIVANLMNVMKKDKKDASIQPFVGEMEMFKGTKIWKFAIYDSRKYELKLKEVNNER